MGVVVDLSRAFQPAGRRSILPEAEALTWLRSRGARFEFRAPEPTNPGWCPLRVRLAWLDTVIIGDGHSFGDIVAAIQEDLTTRMLAHSVTTGLTA